MSKTYVFLAEGFEEIEALATVDVLRRGGVTVDIVSISDSLEIVGSNGIKVVADCMLGEISSDDAECMVVPGGIPGSTNLANSKALINILQKHYDADKYIASICAAPAFVLTQLKVKTTTTMTCYPSCESNFTSDFVYSAAACVIDGYIITGKGPGFAVQFALTVLEKLRGLDVANTVASSMLLTLSDVYVKP